MITKALLFLNGEKPNLQNFSADYLSQFKLIIATDGAYNYLVNSHIISHTIIGDMDSISSDIYKTNNSTNFIKIDEQDCTDFDKALNYLIKTGFSKVEVWGASGKSQDHFLGNLSSALKFKERINIKFYDDNNYYYFLNNLEKQNIPNTPNIINTKVGKTISLYPYPIAKSVITQGLQYQLNQEELGINTRIGIRNCAISNKVTISFSEGELIIFIEH